MTHQFLRRYAAIAATCAALLIPTLTFAGDGHDHGDAKPAANGPALPRFTAQSDLFEAVGILGKEELTLFIDRTATNEPVLGATVELEGAGIKLTGKFEPKLGEYHFDGKAFAKAGEYPIMLTIKAGQDGDLLTGDLHVHDAATGSAITAAHSHGWQRIAQWSAVIAITLVLMFMAIRWAIRKQRNRNDIGAAL